MWICSLTPFEKFWDSGRKNLEFRIQESEGGVRFALFLDSNWDDSAVKQVAQRSIERRETPSVNIC
jgi:hypothetical protein